MFYRISDLLRLQVLMQDALKVFVHGRIIYRILNLNPDVVPFELQMSNVEVEQRQPLQATTNTAKKPTNIKRKLIVVHTKENIKDNDKTLECLIQQHIGEKY